VTKNTKLLAIVISAVFLASSLTFLIMVNSPNTESPTAPKSNVVRVACVGDSLTAISGYPLDLQKMLGDNYTVGNFGVVGSTVTLHSWKPYMNQDEFYRAKNFRPDIVVIILGTNDDLMNLHQYNASLEDDYARLITEFQQIESNPDIFIAKPPPIFSNNSDLSLTYLTNTIIPKTEDLANKMHLPIIDLYSPFSDHADYFEDGIHPNSQGATLIATEVYEMLDYTYDID